MNLDPLYDLRLRTPRLELRLATHDELLELFAVAEAGIHPPEQMPFAVAWTDDLRTDLYLDHYAGLLRAWRPESWTLNLTVFHEGRPAGSQSIGADRFAETRHVKTGSWLGRAFQGRGFGTEMRTAVLELAFRGLGARTAESGALAGNSASARVSEKLGYRHAGWSEVAPRGVPVAHEDFLLDREAWNPPFPVEIEGLEPILPLLGLTG